MILEWRFGLSLGNYEDVQSVSVGGTADLDLRFLEWAFMMSALILYLYSYMLGERWG